MDKKQPSRIAIACMGVFSLFMSACGHYKSDFACKGYPENGSCLPTTQVYERRHEQLTKMRSEDGDPSSSGSTPSSSSSAADRVAAIAGQTEYQLGQPNITQSQVLQVWIAPWRDAKNYLHESSLVYAIVQQADWVYGRKPRNLEKTGSTVFTPQLSRPMFEQTGGKPAPNGGMPMLAAPHSTAAPVPNTPPPSAASSDPSAILRQLQQQMPTVPGSGMAPSPYGAVPGGADQETAREQLQERMQEQREKMFQ